MRTLSVIVAGLLLCPSFSQAKNLEDLLVEKGVISKGEARAAMGGGNSTTGWDNGTRWDHGSNTAKLTTQLQTRYEYFDPDSDTDEESTSGVRVRRARIILSGDLVNKEFSYVMSTDMVGDSDDDGDGNSPRLEDAKITWHACDWTDITVGQFKSGISRQFNNSSAKLQFANRSNVSETFDLGRQHGVEIGGSPSDDWSWKAQMLNGLSDGEGQNLPGTDTKHTGVFALRWNAVGEMNPYEEGDVDNTQDMAWNFGAAYAYQANEDSTGLETEVNGISVDANMKYQGWSLHGEFYWNEAEPDDDSDISTETTGFYAQVGYFITPSEFEIAARYGLVSCDDDDDASYTSGDCVGADEINEVSVTLNYYFWKHNMKFQLGWDHVTTEPVGDGDDVDDNTWLMQWSLYA